jgi:hypothetical protein
MSYGGKIGTKGDDMIGYGIYVVNDDKNFIISGKTLNISSDDTPASATNYDGFVMRLTPIGFIQWVSYLSTKQS